jgi:opacity protein-like surface antigen
MINIVYDLAKFAKLQPYFVAGLGVADVRVRPGVSFIKGTNNSIASLRLKKNNRVAMAFQAGVGAKYPITENLFFDTALKIQGITNVKLKYEKFSRAAGKIKFNSTKQHLGVAEIVAGLSLNF